jgi:hypothetical protein
MRLPLLLAGSVTVSWCATCVGQAIHLDLRAWDGFGWTDYLLTIPGGTARVGLFASFSDAYGLAGLEYQIRGDWTIGGGDGIVISGNGLGRQAPFVFGASTQQVYTTGSTFRIDAAGDAANNPALGILSGQRDPVNAGAAFSVANPALIYTFDIELTNASGSIINVTTPLEQLFDAQGRLQAFVFLAADSLRSTRATAVTVDGVTIDSYTPAPGAAIVMGAAAMFAGLRRRR